MCGNVCTWRFLRSAEAERVHIHLYKKVHLREEWETYIYINVYSIYYFFIHQRQENVLWWFLMIVFFSRLWISSIFFVTMCVFFLRAYPCFKKKVQEGTRFAHTKRRCVITDWSCRGWFAICYTREISCNEL